MIGYSLCTASHCDPIPFSTPPSAFIYCFNTWLKVLIGKSKNQWEMCKMCWGAGVMLCAPATEQLNLTPLIVFSRVIKVQSLPWNVESAELSNEQHFVSAFMWVPLRCSHQVSAVQPVPSGEVKREQHLYFDIICPWKTISTNLKKKMGLSDIKITIMVPVRLTPFFPSNNDFFLWTSAAAAAATHKNYLLLREMQD